MWKKFLYPHYMKSQFHSKQFFWRNLIKLSIKDLIFEKEFSQIFLLSQLFFPSLCLNLKWFDRISGPGKDEASSTKVWWKLIILVGVELLESFLEFWRMFKGDQNRFFAEFDDSKMNQKCSNWKQVCLFLIGCSFTLTSLSGCHRIRC